MNLLGWIDRLMRTTTPPPPSAAEHREEIHEDADSLQAAHERVAHIQRELDQTDAAVRFVEARLRARGRLPQVEEDADDDQH